MSKPVYFVFGNHKHWTGMVWEWGLDSLGNSVRGLKRVLDETGLKAGLNFDGRGIEHLAVNDPEALRILRNLLDERRIEIWGGTFTQPYGSLIGHESNIMQRQYGVRAFERLLGKRPEVFAEEEFDFFPQLPQILKLLGYEKALLFPQHTWHTPTFPVVDDRAIMWRGIDGTSIKAIPYSHRCLMRGIPTANEAIDRAEGGDLLISWLEILDKPNWMWSSDFVLQHLNGFRDRIRPILASDYLDSVEAAREVEYSQDDMFHGIFLGKNGNLPSTWGGAEGFLLSIEYEAAWASFLGPPYPQFSSYPEWEFDNAWRDLMESQGHDALECQGLTDFKGNHFAREVTTRLSLTKAYKKTGESEAFSFDDEDATPSWCTFTDDAQVQGGPLSHPVGLPIGWKCIGKPRIQETKGLKQVNAKIRGPEGKADLYLYESRDGSACFWITFDISKKPNPGILSAVRIPIRLSSPVTRWRVDSPFAVIDVRPNGEWPLKQPTGDWLTSPQWEEEIPRPITGLSFICAETESDAIQVTSPGPMMALAHDDGFDIIAYAYDAWDGDNWYGRGSFHMDLQRVSNPSNKELLLNSRVIGLENNLSLGERYFFYVYGPAFLTAARKVGEELEVRFFETEGEQGEVEVGFLWDIESCRAVDLIGNTIDQEMLVAKKTLTLQVRPRQIVTLRLLFEGKRTEYPDIESYRDIWVG